MQVRRSLCSSNIANTKACAHASEHLQAAAVVEGRHSRGSHQARHMMYCDPILATNLLLQQHLHTL